MLSKSSLHFKFLYWIKFKLEQGGNAHCVKVVHKGISNAVLV